MLRATFCHVRGIGLRAERLLWDSGLVTWSHFRRIKPRFLTERTYRTACEQIDESEAMLTQGDAGYFLRRLDGLHRVRVLPDFASSLAYLDIETDGLGPEALPTVVALYNGTGVRSFVRDLTMGELDSVLSRIPLVITYNGDRFDVPVLQRSAGISIGGAHLDLRPVFRSMGYRGGLKECERLTGMPARHCPVDGARAVALWALHSRSRDDRALRLLQAYNTFDVLSLECLAWKAYGRAMERYPGKLPSTPLRQPPVEYDQAWEEVLGAV